MSLRDDIIEGALPTVPRVASGEMSPEEEKKAYVLEDEIQPVSNETQPVASRADDLDARTAPQTAAYYSQRAQEEGIAPQEDFALIVDQMMGLTQEEALDILRRAIDYHTGVSTAHGSMGVLNRDLDDPNFPSFTWQKINNLVLGYKHCDMDADEWLFQVKAEAAVIHFHSPYPEVRSVTTPLDDPETPCETIRAYALGMIFMGGSTAINTFFYPRQPGINIGPNVLQILLVPCGRLCARFLPDWGFHLRGKRTRSTRDPGHSRNKSSARSSLTSPMVLPVWRTSTLCRSCLST